MTSARAMFKAVQQPEAESPDRTAGEREPRGAHRAAQDTLWTRAYQREANGNDGRQYKRSRYRRVSRDDPRPLVALPGVRQPCGADTQQRTRRNEWCELCGADAPW